LTVTDKVVDALHPDIIARVKEKGLR